MVQNSYLINTCCIRFFFAGRWKQYAKTHHYFLFVLYETTYSVCRQHLIYTGCSHDHIISETVANKMLKETVLMLRMYYYASYC